MKKIVALTATIIVCSLLFTLSGCEFSVNLDKDSTTGEGGGTTVPETAVVEVTNEEGTVISTETVTLSDEGKEISNNFFDKKPDKNTQTGISQDRVQQAIANQQASSDKKPGATSTNEKNNGKPGTTSNNKKPDNTEATPDEDIPYVQDDLAVLKSSQYMIVVRVEGADGETSSKIARNGKKTSFTTMFNGQSISVIIDEENVYLLSNDDKVYVKISKDLLLENATDEEMKQVLQGNPTDFTREVSATYTEEVDTITYNVVEYSNGYKDYLIGKTIIKTVANDGSAMYYDSVSAVAPASLFAPPADYTETSMSSPEVSDFVGEIVETTECTDPSHDHG